MPESIRTIYQFSNHSYLCMQLMTRFKSWLFYVHSLYIDDPTSPWTGLCKCIWFLQQQNWISLWSYTFSEWQFLLVDGKQLSDWKLPGISKDFLGTCDIMIGNTLVHSHFRFISNFLGYSLLCLEFLSRSLNFSHKVWSFGGSDQWWVKIGNLTLLIPISSDLSIKITQSQCNTYLGGGLY